ncbi:unnamed protein product [marine sediment metagenome]|uniref:RNA polymerase sigma factor 70 region 4 type 2 domain-containing protein n=1 Tax=marine sediment metagenome TaxID=412755 RepID=X0SNG1_9ZZZZ
MGLVVHVVNHTAQCRSIQLSPTDREDIVGDVFLALVKDDFAVLRRFRGESSLAPYLTVIARRVVVGRLIARRSTASLSQQMAESVVAKGDMEERISNHEEVQRLLDGLNDSEAEVVRLYHLEGQSYQEISTAVGMPTNSVGPLLSRAREKMRGAADPAG